MEPLIDRRTGVNFIIMREGDNGMEFIMQKRDARSSQFVGCWCIPGGGQKGEEQGDFRRTATREAFSETGIRILEESWSKLCDRPDNNPGVVLYTVVPRDTIITLGEGAAMEWKTLREFKQYAREGLIGYHHENWLLPALEDHLILRCEATVELSRSYRGVENL